ncbi:hypothetical protein OROGR_007679 [Orobanche gracilis]
MAIRPSPFNITRNDSLSPNSNFLISSFKPTCKPRFRPFVITFSCKPRNEIVGNDEKREFLEHYGLNPDDFLSKPYSKKIREKGNTGMRNHIPPEEPKPPRETHKLLQVLGGSARRRKLLSPKGMDVRPMMQVVKGAAFSILQAAGGSPQSLMPGRWLDLYSGTGSVGIEAISRGCSKVHFVEMDPWVVSDVLRPNLELTGFLDVSVIHTARVETFLQNAEKFVVVAVVEYPSRTDMLDSYAGLVKIADRRFGRTHLAIYGPNWAKKKSKLDT